MSGGREATSEQSSLVREGADYNEVYQLGCGPEEGSTQSPKRELSAHSLDDEGEEEYEDDEEGKDNEGEEGEGEEEEEIDEKSQEESDGLVGQVDGSSSRPFILHKTWMVNDFYPSMP